jgi:hypothetical protein
MKETIKDLKIKLTDQIDEFLKSEEIDYSSNIFINFSEFSTNVIIHVEHKDYFYSSITQSSYIGLVELGTTLHTEQLFKIKKRIFSKMKQVPLLEKIRGEGLEKIKEFIKDSFKIKAGAFNTKDVKWLENGRFEIGEAIFGFYVNLSKETFNIQEYRWESYQMAFNISMHILNFYSLKDKQKTKL